MLRIFGPFSVVILDGKGIVTHSSYYKAISTSNRARYEYTSGDILYLRFPANMIRDLDFLRSDATVYRHALSALSPSLQQHNGLLIAARRRATKSS